MLASVVGAVYEDVDGSGVREAEESGIAGVVVFIDGNQNGSLDRQGVGIEPDDFMTGQTLDGLGGLAIPSATDTRLGNTPLFQVTSVEDMHASTGIRVIGVNGQATWDNSRGLRVDFPQSVHSVSVDVVGASAASSDVLLEAFDSEGRVLGSRMLAALDNAVFDRLSIERSDDDISFVVVKTTNARGSIRLDNLRANGAEDELATLSGANGFYRLYGFDAGEITLRQIPPDGYEHVSPAPEPSHTVVVGTAATNLNFGNRTASMGGIAFNDAGVPGQYEPGRDASLANVGLFLDVNRNGVADRSTISVDPDTFVENQSLEFAVSGLRIMTADSRNELRSEPVTASADPMTDPDGKVFTSQRDAGWNDDHRLSIQFDAPASFVSLDFIGGARDEQVGTLLAFSANGDQVAFTMTSPVGFGQRTVMSLNRAESDIHRIVAYTTDPDNGAGRLDNLRATVIDEPVALSDQDGEFQFKPLTAGMYQIGVLPPTGRIITFPPNGVHNEQVEIGDSLSELHFGLATGNQLPFAGPDHGRTVEDTSVAIGVLVNDTDFDGLLDPASVSVTQSPLHGTAEVTVDGQIIYIPDENYHGTDTLIYTVRDDQSGESNSAVVTIDVASVNDSPQASDDSVRILPGGETVIGVLQNDLDVDNEIDPSSITIVSPPTRGTATVDARTGNIRYVSSGAGPDSFRYTVQDRLGIVSNVAIVSITSRDGGRAPTAVDDVIAVLEGSQAAINVLNNDIAADGLIQAATLLIVRQPDWGVARANLVTGSIQYTPTLGFVGEDSFQYLVRDDLGLSSNFASVNISVFERDFPYQNPVNNIDVNADGLVVPRDSLLIINEINNREISDQVTARITVPIRPPVTPAAYLDVNADGFVTPLDVLWVVNFINNSDGEAVGASLNNFDVELAAAALESFGLTEDDSEDLGRHRDIG